MREAQLLKHLEQENYPMVMKHGLLCDHVYSDGNWIDKERRCLIESRREGRIMNYADMVSER